MRWLRRQLAELVDPAPQSYFAIVPDGVTPSLCAPADSYRALVDAVIAVSIQANVRLGYRRKGKTEFISDQAQLAQEISSRPLQAVRLVSDLDGRELIVYLEQWQVEGNILTAPRPNPVTIKIYLDSPTAKVFLDTPGALLDSLYPTPLAETSTFDVDVVYTWVNYEDPDWQKLFAEHSTNQSNGGLNADRYTSRDELKYSLRSLLKFAPWVRTVYVVSNCTPPDWFDETNQRVRWVYHNEIMDDAHLPTFNSHAIEASIHRTPRLSEHFLYFNDDIFLLKPVTKSDFFVPNGLAKIRPEPYGVVHGEVNANDPDYINAARNVQALLQGEFRKTVTKHHTHSPQSMLLSVVEACERTFTDAYEQTRSHRFRSVADISPTSFMYPNFAYLTGKAVMDYPKASLVSMSKPYHEILGEYEALMASSTNSKLPLTLCLNDGGGSAADDDWSATIVEFMQSAFDEVSEAEIAHE